MKIYFIIVLSLLVFKLQAVTVFFFEQQSNSVGVGLNSELDPSLTGNIPGCYFWNGTNFLPLSSTNCQYPKRTDTEHGAQLSLMKYYHDRTGETCYGIMYSIAGIGAFYTNNISTFFPYQRGTYADKFISTCNAALRNLWESGVRSNYKFIFVPQGGESDCNPITNANVYGYNLTGLLTLWKNNLNCLAFKNSKKYVVIPKISIKQGQGANTSIVQAAMDSIATAGISGIDGIKTLSQETYDWSYTPGGNGLHHIALGYKKEGYGIDSTIYVNGW